MMQTFLDLLRPITQAKLVVRPWEAKDAQVVIDLINLVFKEFNHRLFIGKGEFNEHLLWADKHFASIGGSFVVLERQAEGKAPEIIATVAFAKAKPGVATFDYLMVHPQYQGRGYILPLMNWAKEQLIAHRIRHVEAWSNVARPKAHKLYRHLGFKQDGTTRWTTGCNPNFQQYFFHLDVETALMEKAVRVAPLNI